ncbi:MAG: phosphotransferase [Pseudomonadales bacterium]|nr:phosphotransferase [Pseudomonadales bacterium]
MTDRGLEAIYAPAVEDALAAFPVPVSVVELINVSENVTWRVTDTNGSRFVLRLHRPGYHSLEELIAERAWIRGLDAAGIRVPRAVLTTTGAEYATVYVAATGEHRHAGLARWAEGEVLGRLLDPDAGTAADRARVEDWFVQLGELIAALHNQASSWPVPEGFRRHSLDAEGLMGREPFWGRFWEYPALTETQGALLARVRGRLHAWLDALPRTPETWSLIHADLHAYNLLVHEQALAVIDFDDTGFGWHQYDLAVALRHYQGEPSFGYLRDALLRGYRRRRPLTDAVAAQIPTFILVRRLASVGWLMQRPELGEVLAPDEIDRLCRDVTAFLDS